MAYQHIKEHPTNENLKIINFFYLKNKNIDDFLISHYNIKKEKILDVGGEFDCFPLATDIIDIKELQGADIHIHKIDIDFDTFPFEENYFNFMYCRHTLEDIQNPMHAFHEITRVSKKGYIETPSPLIEIMRGADSFGEAKYMGYCHHRYFVWTDYETNTLYFLPKYNLIEYIKFDEDFLKEKILLLNNDYLFWNNYYFFDEKNKSAIFVYRNEVNFQFKDYTNLLVNGILKSIENTKMFLKKNNIQNIKYRS